jgi:hypothetical protein
LYNDKTKDTFTVSTARAFFSAIPSFTFSVCFGAITKIASTHLDPHLIIWVHGRRFTWRDFFEREHGQLVGSVTFTMPSAGEAMGMLVFDMLMYLVLAWYFDHILSHNRGVADPWYFLFTEKYWRSFKQANIDAEKEKIRESRKAKEKKKKAVMDDYSGDIGLATTSGQ